MLSQKERLSLKLVIKNGDNFTTSQQLATSLAVSDRTARKYVHQLNYHLADHGATIEAIRGQGYRLIISDNTKFKAYYEHAIRDISGNENGTTIHESDDRQYYILHLLFFDQKRVFVDEIADSLFVSRSTISNDLVSIKKLLDDYQITLESRSGYGIYVSGDEQNFRHFMMNYFFMTRLQDNFYAFSMYTNLLEEISIEEILIIVLDECREASLQISDFIVFNLVLHIALAVKRIQAGYEIDSSRILNGVEESVEYQTSLKIISRLEDYHAINFPPEEAEYIAMHLRNKTAKKIVLKQLSFDEEQIKRQLEQVLSNIQADTGYQIADDMILFDGLLLHFTPLLLRLQNNTSIGNPLLTQIKSSFPDLFSLTISYFSEMAIFKEFTVTENEWAYLTIHLTAALERSFNKEKVNVLVICATGLGSSQMVRARLEHELGSKITIKKVISYYEISEEILENIDLIITTIGLPNIVHNAPVCNVSVFLDATDLATINQELSQIKGTRVLSDLKSDFNPKLDLDYVSEKEEDRFLLQKYLHKDLFIQFNEPQIKKDVINTLVQRIEILEGDAIGKSLKGQLQLRESFSSVAFSKDLAVPHPIEPVTRKAHVAVAVAPEGIYWDADFPAIRLVFLLSPDRLNLSELEKVSLMLVPIIEDDALCERLVQAQMYEELIEILVTN